MAPRVHTLFVVDTLEFLARGGRIGKASAFLGGLLRIKPILGVADGEIAGRSGAGRARRPPRLMELVQQRVDRQRPLLAGICHANAPAWADNLERLVREQLQIAELIQAEVRTRRRRQRRPRSRRPLRLPTRDDELRWLAPL